MNPFFGTRIDTKNWYKKLVQELKRFKDGKVETIEPESDGQVVDSWLVFILSSPVFLFLEL